MALRSIELFAGGGGLALGLEAVGVRTVCYVEREAYAAAVLAARMGEGRLAPAPVWSDVRTFDGRRWRGVVDLVAGGFPCQDISSAGKGAGIANGERSGLWREFARVIGEVGPRYVFVENVAALLGRGLDVVLGDLASLGFDAEWGVFRASDVGAPHRRERIFILAHAPGAVVRQEPPTGFGRSAAADGACLDDASGWRRDPRMELQTGRRRRWRGAPMAGVALADTLGTGLPGRTGGLGDDGEKRAPAERGGRDVLADPDERGCEGERIDWLRNGERAGRGDDVDGHSGRAPWPPGPQDAEGWHAYLARWPGLEPALRRGADGLACRVDRLRVLGNGVVPDQAELAFRILFRRLME